MLWFAIIGYIYKENITVHTSTLFHYAILFVIMVYFICLYSYLDIFRYNLWMYVNALIDIQICLYLRRQNMENNGIFTIRKLPNLVL